MTIIFDGNAADGLVLGGWAPSDFPFSVAADPLPPVITTNGTTSCVTVDDVDYLDHTGAAGYNNGQALTDADGTWQSLTPSIGTIDASGLITHVTDGVCRVGRDNGRGMRSAEVALTSFEDDSARSFVGFHAGSVCRTFTDAIDDLIVGKTYADVKNIWTTQNHAAGIYVRNPSCLFAPDLLTPQSVYNSFYLYKSCATAISPHFAVMATHQRLFPGDTCRWVGPTGTVYDRTIVDSQPVIGDLAVVLLSSALPTEVGFYGTLPADWKSYAKTLGAYAGDPGSFAAVPVFYTNFDEEVSLSEWYIEDAAGVVYDHCQNPTGDRASFATPIEYGDSSSPVVADLDGTPVFLFPIHFGLGASAPTGVSLSNYVTETNATMALMATNNGGLGSGETVTHVSFSSYTNYS